MWEIVQRRELARPAGCFPGKARGTLALDSDLSLSWREMMRRCLAFVLGVQVRRVAGARESMLSERTQRGVLKRAQRFLSSRSRSGEATGGAGARACSLFIEEKTFGVAWCCPGRVLVHRAISTSPRAKPRVSRHHGDGSSAEVTGLMTCDDRHLVYHLGSVKRIRSKSVGDPIQTQKLLRAAPQRCGDRLRWARSWTICDQSPRPGRAREGVANPL